MDNLSLYVVLIPAFVVLFYVWFKFFMYTACLFFGHKIECWNTACHSGWTCLRCGHTRYSHTPYENHPGKCCVDLPKWVDRKRNNLFSCFFDRWF